MMEFDMIRNLLCNELKRYNTLKSVNRTDLDTIHVLTDTIKNLDKIKMLNEKDSLEVTEHNMMSEEDRMVLRRAIEVLNR